MCQSLPPGGPRPGLPLAVQSHLRPAQGPLEGATAWGSWQGRGARSEGAGARILALLPGPASESIENGGAVELSFRQHPRVHFDAGAGPPLKTERLEMSLRSSANCVSCVLSSSSFCSIACISRGRAATCDTNDATRNVRIGQTADNGRARWTRAWIGAPAVGPRSRAVRFRA